MVYRKKLNFYSIIPLLIVLNASVLLLLKGCIHTGGDKKTSRVPPAEPPGKPVPPPTNPPNQKSPGSQDPSSRPSTQSPLPPGGKQNPPPTDPGGMEVGFTPTSDIKHGMATHFEALGTPSGGCGVPFESLETPNFVALNVQHTPQEYSSHLLRPIPPSQENLIGEFNNGKNCGRWVLVTIGERCTGINDGQKGLPFCRAIKGTTQESASAESLWVSDGFTGASLPMIITDSCQDDNAWCRDDRYHLDLATSSLALFKKNGKLVGNMLPDMWANRKVSWRYIKAPNYQGDIKIAMVAKATPYWVTIMITHLENGIHGVEAKTPKGFERAQMVGDNGQVYTLPQNAVRPYEIRIKDIEGKYIQNGRIYRFDFPSSCGSECRQVRTPLTYSTS